MNNQQKTGNDLIDRLIDQGLINPTDKASSNYLCIQGLDKFYNDHLTECRAAVGSCFPDEYSAVLKYEKTRNDFFDADVKLRNIASENFPLIESCLVKFTSAQLVSIVDQYCKELIKHYILKIRKSINEI